MASPIRMNVPGLEEEVILNDRSVIRLKETRLTRLLEDEAISLVRAIRGEPERFGSRDFGALASRLRSLAQEIGKQESALMREVFSDPTPGKIHAFFGGTSEVCERLLKEFLDTIRRSVEVSDNEIRTEVQLANGLSLPTLSQPYKVMFGEGRWFELACGELVRKAVSSTGKTFELVFDSQVLGRSGLWHEVDLMLVTRDLSVCFQITAGAWGRNDVIQLLAQREDIGTDIGVLATLTPASEPFDPIAKAHPIRVFADIGGSPISLREWVRTSV